MNVIVTKSFQESNVQVAQQFISLLQQKPSAKLGFATGGSVEGVYACMLEAYRRGELDFAQVSSINLDEYIGLDGSHPQSYRYYMDQHLFDHVNIDKKRIYVPDGKAEPSQELKIFQKNLYGENLDEQIDLQLLGVGVNGHIGFNEPNEELLADVHIEELIASTIEANSRYFQSTDEVPRQAFTVGIGDILKARRIVLIASGTAKAQAIRELLNHNKVTTQCPVTLLKLHPDVTVMIDEKLARLAGYPN